MTSRRSNIRSSRGPRGSRPVTLTYRGTVHEGCRILSWPTRGHQEVTPGTRLPSGDAVSGNSVVCGCGCGVGDRGLFPPGSRGASGRADIFDGHDHAGTGGSGQSRAAHQLQGPPQRPAARRCPRSPPVRRRADGAGTTQPLGGPHRKSHLQLRDPSPSGSYALQLSAETYRDDAAAAARIPVNVDALRAPGVNPIPITIGRTTAI